MLSQRYLFNGLCVSHYHATSWLINLAIQGWSLDWCVGRRHILEVLDKDIGISANGGLDRCVLESVEIITTTMLEVIDHHAIGGRHADRGPIVFLDINDLVRLFGIMIICISVTQARDL